MPELPEVETTIKAIQPLLLGNSFTDIKVYQSQLRWQITPNISSLMTQSKVIACWRRGKYLVIEFAHGACLIHLGMSGKLAIKSKNSQLDKHDHVIFELESSQIHFNDPRRFGCVLWTNCVNEHKLIRNLGIEPLSDDFTTDYLYNNTRNKQVNIKTWLMNAKNIVGVGNIYANEALFLTKILPTRSAKSISKVEAALLVDFIQKVLLKAIAAGGTTLKDFQAPDASLGYFKQELLVYGRESQPCSNCKTLITMQKINQRATFFCHICQV